MLTSKLARSFFPLSLLAYLIGLAITPSAQSISITGNLSWTGLGSTTVTGAFTGSDLNSDGYITGSVVPSANELSAFTVSFTDPSNSGSAQTYTLSQLLSFSNYNISSGFLFNYNIATHAVSQTGLPTDLTNGLSIGDPLAIGDPNSGYLLESTGNTSPNNLSLTDNINFNGDSGGTVTATPVPFEFDATAGILTLGAIWGVNQWRKNRVKK
jgi:hypothetical protein